jgi:hypothetical protein
MAAVYLAERAAPISQRVAPSARTNVARMTGCVARAAHPRRTRTITVSSMPAATT